MSVSSATDHPASAPSVTAGATFTPGPWDCVQSTQFHGAYVTSEFGSNICDCYVMTKPGSLSVRNGGDSEPVPFMGEMMDPNARLIAAAPELYEALILVVGALIEHAPHEQLAIQRAQFAVRKAEGR